MREHQQTKNTSMEETPKTSKTPTNPEITEGFVCDICEARFGTLSELQEHKRGHADPINEFRQEQNEMRGDIGAAGLPTSPLV